MKILNSSDVIISALALMFTAGAAQATQFVVNGDFSNPNVDGGYTMSSSVPGWHNLVDGGLVEVGSSYIYGLPSINSTGQSAEINANTFGDVVQTISGLTVGNYYSLSYEYGGRNGGGTQSMKTSFGGNILGGDTGSTGVWTSDAYTVLATATSEVLEFKADHTDGTPSYGNEVTNVSLIGAVPEPTSWAMMLVGMAAIGFAARRRRNVSVTYA